MEEGGLSWSGTVSHSPTIQPPLPVRCVDPAKQMATKAQQCTLVRNCTLVLKMEEARSVDGLVFTIGDASRERRQAM
jgi:hypothetical protein